MTTPTVDEVLRYLAELPDMCALLPEAAIVRTPRGEGSRSMPGPRPPLRLDVLHLLDTRDKGWMFDAPPDPDRVGVLPFLDSWARDLEATALDERPELPDELPDPPTVTGLCKWLAGEAQWASELPQWPEMADGIHKTWKAVRIACRAVREVEGRAVPCNRCGAGELRHVEGDKPMWECSECEHRVTVQAVTLRQAAKILRDDLGASAPTLRTLQRWALRPGLLRPIADSPKRRLFDMGQIRSVAAEERIRGSA